DRIGFLRVDRAHLVNGLAEHVEHAAQRFATHGNADGTAERDRFHAANQAFSGLHRDGADAAFADVLFAFADDIDGLGHVEALAHDADGGVDFGDLPFGELAVDGRSCDLHDCA